MVIFTIGIMPRSPLPIVVPPSGTFDGDDGAWSTFLINVGDTGDGRSGQNFKALVSTSHSTTVLPMKTVWCNESSCASDRGVLPHFGRQSTGYQATSSDYQELGLFSLESETELEPPRNGLYGLDSIGMGLASAESPVLLRQLVVGHMSESPYLSSLGLSPNPVGLGSKPFAPYLASANTSGAIPSLSYSYTAGAKYRALNMST
jgi:hypothetical protein